MRCIATSAFVPKSRNAGDDATYAPNERIFVLSLRQDGNVVEDYGDAMLVSIGPMKTVVKKSDVRRSNVPAAERKRAHSASAEEPIETVARSTAELDVRGKRYVDAEPLVERWIDAALLAGSSPVRLIHGKGTGMLGRGLQEYLRTHPSVQSVRYGNEEEGSAGVTIVELRS